MAEIIERENGPLIVKGLASMTDTDGAPLELKPVRALCRCGHSKNKPFCDGSHNSNGFQSRDGKPAGRDRLIAYEGADVTVFFNPRVCSATPPNAGGLRSTFSTPINAPGWNLTTAPSIR